MSGAYEQIIQRLDGFIRKYYKNSLIRGVIYVVTGLLAMYLVVAVSEYFGRFTTSVRTALVILTASTMLLIVYKWILDPLAGFYRIRKVMSYEEAAQIVGKHFPEVSDRLLNILQLRQQSVDTGASVELLEAAIQQKSASLRTVSFTKAIDLKKNLPWLRYTAIPLVIIIALLLVAPGVLTEPTKRLVNPGTHFAKPAPFRYILENKSMEAIRQQDFEVLLRVEGNELPDRVTLVADGFPFMMEKTDRTHFRFVLKNLSKDVSFHFESDDYSSASFVLKVKPDPRLISLSMEITYPAYLGKAVERIENASELSLPTGTVVKWMARTSSSDRLFVHDAGAFTPMPSSGLDLFTYATRVKGDAVYYFVPFLQNQRSTDSLAFSIKAIPDLYPQITIEERPDSTAINRIYMLGSVSDDHGFHSLKFFYRDQAEVLAAEAKGDLPYREVIIQIAPDLTEQRVYYTLDLPALGYAPGTVLSYYFEVRDNDAPAGYKASRTAEKTMQSAGKKELMEQLEKDAKNIEKELTQGVKKAKDLQKELAELSKKLLEKKTLSWEEQERMKQLLKQQKELQEKMQRIAEKQSDKARKQEQVNPESERMLEKQKELEDLMKKVLTDEMKQKMEELEKLLQQLDKEKTQEALDQMKQDARDLEKEMDRTLELYKQMEFEQKLEKTTEQLNKLAEKQEKLSQKSEQGKEEKESLEKEQEQLTKEFDELKKEMRDLEEKNKSLEEPNNLEDTKKEEQEISEEQQESSDQLKKNEKSKAGKSQKNASEKMKEMAKKLEKSMEEASDNAEDAEALRQILENLVQVSFRQEELMARVKTIDRNNPQYLQIIQQQKKLRDDSKMIEDSLFALSKRQPKVEPMINREIADINQNMEKSIRNLVDRNQSEAASRQQFVMTSVNNLALLLSESLSEMMQQQQQQKNSKSKPGSGSCNKPGGAGGKKKSMAQMKAMQDELNKNIQKLKQQMEKGNQQGKGQPRPKPGEGGTGGTSKELAKLAAQQEALRRELQKAAEGFNKDGKSGSGELGKVLEKMEQTEKDLVNKRISEETIRRQQEILTRLLEAEKAEREQDQDEKRESREGKNFEKRNPEEIFKYNGRITKEAEMLRTIPPAMNGYYRNKVNRYFNRSAEIR